MSNVLIYKGWKYPNLDEYSAYLISKRGREGIGGPKGKRHLIGIAARNRKEAKKLAERAARKMGWKLEDFKKEGTTAHNAGVWMITYPPGRYGSPGEKIERLIIKGPKIGKEYTTFHQISQIKSKK